MQEEFRPTKVPGYMVSNTGKVLSLKRGRLMKQSPNADGYLKVALRDSLDGQRLCTSLVHRLVAEAFVDNPDDLPEVDHRDQDKANNDFSNLRWATRFDQQRNSPNNVHVLYKGEEHVLKDICCNLSGMTLYRNILSRVHRGKGTHQEVFDFSIRGL